MRKLPEWKGRTDDAAIPERVKDEILEGQSERCAVCTREFSDKLKPEYDHEVALGLGGPHRQSNLRAICRECHTAKTKADATAIARVRRIRYKSRGIKRRKKPWPGQDKFLKKVDGTVVERKKVTLPYKGWGVDGFDYETCVLCEKDYPPYELQEHRGHLICPDCLEQAFIDAKEARHK